ncbi:MAG: hypothetical protein HY063_04865 [Bacteroidetes bacterium]|nr:hypothetical protein [Bacteroidota bacterium]
MNAILIKPSDKSIYSKLIQLINSSKSEAKIISEDEFYDTLLLDSIEEGMKSGKASKASVNKFFAKHGIRIH